MSSFKVLGLFISMAAAMIVPTGTTPPPGPASPEPTFYTACLDCDIEYCDGSTSWCHYWAGMTTYDPTLGPLPGETRVPVGLCGSETFPAVTVPTSVPYPGA
ncbi:hypothetical protein LIA77_04331 [Sarocladium implicatum]|nr:hypothetical protein LIA77_04331 [Sarocladium implicatum]